MTLSRKVIFNLNISRTKIVRPCNYEYFKDIPVEVRSSEKDTISVRIDETLREKFSQMISQENLLFSIKFHGREKVP